MSLYRLRCHTQIEFNGCDKFELYGRVFCFFFTKLSPVTLRKRNFFYDSRFLKNLNKEVLVLNNGFDNYTACFEIRVLPSTAYLKTYEVFFIKLV